MTIVEYRPAHTIDAAAVQALACLVVDPAAPEGDLVPVVVISPTGAHPNPFCDGYSETADATASTVSDLVRDLPTLDQWIIDLELRNGRVAVLTRQALLCSAPLLPTPPGWTAAVAARGLLDVVLRYEVAAGVSDALPPRAIRADGSVAARVPVCLT